MWTSQRPARLLAKAFGVGSSAWLGVLGRSSVPIRKKLRRAFGRKLQPGISPLLDDNVSIDFLVCEHSQLKEEVRFKCGVQESLSEMSTIGILRARINGRSDAFRAVTYNFLDFRLVTCSRLLAFKMCSLRLSGQHAVISALNHS